MQLMRNLYSAALAIGLLTSVPALAAEAPAKIYERVTPSLVAVKYTWDFELRRQELTGAGIVMTDDGLIVCSIGVFNPLIPDAQMRDFKIIIPSQEKDAEEIEAEFLGRDERTNLAFLRPKVKSDKSPAVEKKDEAKPTDGEKKPEGDKKDSEPKVAPKSKPAEKHKWTPIMFEDVPVKIGQKVFSVGVLPEMASYKTYLMDGIVSTHLRGEFPQVLVSGGLAGVGSPVFNGDGKVVGFVNMQTATSVFLNDGPNALAAIQNPPKFFTPSKDLLLSFKTLPTQGKPMDLPWVGVVQMAGLNKDVAEVYNLQNQPAVQVGDVVPNAPAAKAGLKQGDIIVKINGEALERGDEADELPVLLRRKMVRMAIGDEVTLSIMRKRGEPMQDLKIKLEAQPKGQNLAARYYAEDLGFGVREMVFNDTYARRLAADAKGVVVSLTKPQGAAQSGGLQGNGSPRSDVIITLNGQPISDLEQFKTAYKTLRKDKPKEAVIFVVRREGREDTVRIEPPQ